MFAGTGDLETGHRPVFGGTCPAPGIEHIACQLQLVAGAERRTVQPDMDRITVGIHGQAAHPDIVCPGGKEVHLILQTRAAGNVAGGHPLTTVWLRHHGAVTAVIQGIVRRPVLPAGGPAGGVMLGFNNQ